MPTKRQFIDALEAAKNIANPTPVNTSRGPILPLYSIDFRSLPLDEQIKQLMKNIMRSGGPLDHSALKTSIGDDTLGAMRQIHGNNPHYLPVIDPQGATSGRARVLDHYAKSYKHHSADRGGGSESTGYVEYTAGTNKIYDWGGNRCRIVFDYLNSKLYFSPFHYASWDLSVAGQVNIIDKPPAGSGHPNPFFWIIEL
jgi:hypothetical protein